MTCVVYRNPDITLSWTSLPLLQMQFFSRITPQNFLWHAPLNESNELLLNSSKKFLPIGTKQHDGSTIWWHHLMLQDGATRWCHHNMLQHFEVFGDIYNVLYLFLFTATTLESVKRSLFSNGHSAVLSRINDFENRVELQPCCYPKSLSKLSLLYVNDRNEYIREELANMIVNTCACSWPGDVQMIAAWRHCDVIISCD